MKRKWIAFLITICMLASTYGLLPLLITPNKTDMPRVVKGVIDLSEWDISQGGMIRLDGEWEFYPGQLLDHMHFAKSGEKPVNPMLIAVPGSWSESMETLGKATYRLMIKGGEDNQVYGIKTLSIQMASKIILNGEVISNSGNPDDHAYVAKNHSYATYFNLQPGDNEFIIQVANYHFPASSGIKHPIYLGSQDQISQLQKKAIAYDWITITSFLMMGLYFVGLYIQRKSDYSLLYFGLLCFFVCLFTATQGERVIYDLFAQLPAWLFLRIQLGSSLGAAVAMLLYVSLVFRPFCFGRLVTFTLYFGAAFIVLCLVSVSITYNQLVLTIHSLYCSIAAIYMMYVLVLATLHRIEGSFYLLISAVALNFYAFVQNINVYIGIPVFTYPPIESLVFLLMISLLMSLRFSNAYKKMNSYQSSSFRRIGSKTNLLPGLLMNLKHRYIVCCKLPIRWYVIRLNRSHRDSRNG